jgi:hypothetical protein
MHHVNLLTGIVLCLAAQGVAAADNLSNEALRWTQSTMADKFAECSVFFNSMSIWPGMTDEASLQLAELADVSTKQLVGYVDGDTAAQKIDTASASMWAPYNDRTVAVPPSAFISKYTSKCARLLSATDVVLLDVMKEGDRRFPR